MDLDIMIPDARVRDALLSWLRQPRPPIEPLGPVGTGRTELVHVVTDI